MSWSTVSDGFDGFGSYLVLKMFDRVCRMGRVHSLLKDTIRVVFTFDPRPKHQFGVKIVVVAVVVVIVVVVVVDKASMFEDSSLFYGWSRRSRR